MKTDTSTPDPHFALTRHAALKRRREGVVLVLPERAMRLGGSGGEIMQLCESGRSRGEILAELHARYPARSEQDASEIEAEVDRFLAEMVELGGLTRSVSAAEPS